jgi:hypothetical protein
MQLLCLILKGKVDLLDGPEIQESPQDNYQQQKVLQQRGDKKETKERE